jgi:signal transduction histidine kinase
MHSLRWKLVLGTLSGLTLLLAAAGTAAYLAVRERLYSEFDRNLIQRTVLMASMIEHDASGIKIEWLETGNSPPGHQPGMDYFSVWTKGRNEALAASPDLEQGSLPRFGGSFAHPELRHLVLAGKRPARCAGIEFDVRQGLRSEDGDDRLATAGIAVAPPGETIVQVVIARLDTVAPTLAAIRWPLIVLWAGCTILGGVFIWLVVRRSLRPLDQLQAQIARLKEGVSGQRVALPEQPVELEPVTRELNHLLERVEKALLRERTLTSNVAHELRTPIAGLLSTLEVTLNRLRPAAEYKESAEECLEIAKRMNWLVNNLLSIARIEAGNVQLQYEEVRLETALTEWWKPFEARAGERGLRIERHIERGATMQTDPEFLRVVVTNLFDNAVSYATEGGTIRIEANSAGTVSVANQAGTLNAEVIQHAFEPFWRNSGPRDGQVAHAGLGLNLCRQIIELLGGRIHAQIQEPERLFAVRLEMRPPQGISRFPAGTGPVASRPSPQPAPH